MLSFKVLFSEKKDSMVYVPLFVWYCFVLGLSCFVMKSSPRYKYTQGFGTFIPNNRQPLNKITR